MSCQFALQTNVISGESLELIAALRHCWVRLAMAAAGGRVAGQAGNGRQEWRGKPH